MVGQPPHQGPVALRHAQEGEHYPQWYLRRHLLDQVDLVPIGERVEYRFHLRSCSYRSSGVIRWLVGRSRAVFLLLNRSESFRTATTSS
jgi:hypothetical protein